MLSDRRFKLFHFSTFLHSSQKICDLRGWPAGSDKNTETHEVMLKIWEGLRSKADKDNDGQVSESEAETLIGFDNRAQLHWSSLARKLFKLRVRRPKQIVHKDSIDSLGTENRII
jgi:hypothetical protein